MSAKNGTREDFRSAPTERRILEQVGRGHGGFALSVPPELVEAFAEQTAERLAEMLPDRPEPYMNVKQAAEYIAAPKSRIYDLVRDGRLTQYKDGSRSVFRREDLDAALIRSGVRP